MGVWEKSAEAYEDNANTCRSIADGMVAGIEFIADMSPHNQERIVRLHEEGEQYARALARIFTSMAAIHLSESEVEDDC
ncbi:hypothetical protein [Rhodopirellula bahusiensis]|uniref:Uncharacterized protein n=1 Tax=Rhodopirellula bahusiensis TaxID=2014065 RepID=A0A2G1WAZ9_9BACT|nr:hypothetical protein [Rhodopirellula bahusiensis]PHQ35809.1 hypothetical protein CEE69_09475 [Rhodopirellula bahusiensis]